MNQSSLLLTQIPILLRSLFFPDSESDTTPAITPMIDSTPPESPCLVSLLPPPPRRSSKTTHPPAHLQPYVCTLPPSLSGSSSISSCFQSSINTATLEPNSYHQAVLIPAWQKAM